MPELPNTLSRNKKTDSLARRKAKRFYQTRTWRHLRKAKKERDRKRDEQRALTIYEQSTDNTAEDLARFMASDMPMCELHAKDSLLRPAKVLDHKRRIRDGGHKTKETNLQWLCMECDAAKCGKEAHE